MYSLFRYICEGLLKIHESNAYFEKLCLSFRLFFFEPNEIYLLILLCRNFFKHSYVYRHLESSQPEYHRIIISRVTLGFRMGTEEMLQMDSDFKFTQILSIQHAVTHVSCKYIGNY